MAHSINNVNVQIPGTMYYLQLTADRGRWILALLLRGDVENETIVPVFSKNGIIKAANELLNNSRLVIDKYPLKNVCDQLFAEAERSLPVSQSTIQPVEQVETVDISEFKQKIDLLENTLENVSEELKESINLISDRLDALENDRVSRLEADIHKDETKSNENLITDLVGRLDKIEEHQAQTKGDDRVPSILTAIEALESKLKQLEGKTLTSGNEPVKSNGDVGGLKDDIGKLAYAFDLINQRLTTLENRFKPVEAPAVIEGAPVVQAPTEPRIEPPTEPEG
ncbi:MAG: hypothetical protein JXA54_08450 [Candidatus Heimdallarchaeota archaeon]|nr:hypothetical protein [Candidatus Heimdallarchaeota archaeon]